VKLTPDAVRMPVPAQSHSTSAPSTGCTVKDDGDHALPSPTRNFKYVYRVEQHPYCLWIRAVLLLNDHFQHVRADSHMEIRLTGF
jgi:hypothetical protein